MVEIKNMLGEIIFEYNGANLRDADLHGVDLHGADLLGIDLRGVNLRDADLVCANLRGDSLRGADLHGASLRYADLVYADLRGVDLCDADLRGAALRGADLRGADLHGAKGYNKYEIQPLYSLLEYEVGIGYKVVTRKGEGIYNGGIIYKIGKTIIDNNPLNRDEFDPCGAGINLALLNWCIKEFESEYKILVCEFPLVYEGQPNICIPVTSDGKFRVQMCKVLRELDYKKYGLNE